MLGCQVGSALAESKWAMEHVDSLERAAGFPGIYFDLQVEGIKKYSSLPVNILLCPEANQPMCT